MLNLWDATARGLWADVDAEGSQGAEPEVDEARPAERLDEADGVPVALKVHAKEGIFEPERGLSPGVNKIEHKEAAVEKQATSGSVTQV